MRTLQYLKTSSAAVLLFIISLLANTRAWAQSKGVDVNVDLDGNDGPWYGYWWMWALGIGIFLIIIVAIISAGKKT